MHWVVDTVRHYLLAWGYFAIVLGLVGEDIGLPLPGETIVIFASFLAYKGEYFQLAWVIIAAILASTAGDNLGFLFGHKARRRFIRHWRFILHISDNDLASGEELLRRHGSLAIFVARWIWGFRIMAGPLAGILRMPWKSFFFYNFLGAISWACTMAMFGYLFGQFATIYGFFEKADITLSLAIILVTAYWWRRYRRRFSEAKRHGPRKSD